MPPGRILLVDDEEALLRLMYRYLVRLGYEVDPCAGAEQAWALFQSQPHEYALAIVDLMMPGMPGQELIRRMLEVSPGLRVLTCSGHPFADSRLVAAEPGRVRMLVKPFVPQMLADAVNEMLQENVAAPGPGQAGDQA